MQVERQNPDTINDNLSNKCCEDNMSVKRENDEISNKSFKSKRS